MRKCSCANFLIGGKGTSHFHLKCSLFGGKNVVWILQLIKTLPTFDSAWGRKLPFMFWAEEHFSGGE